VPGGLRR